MFEGGNCVNVRRVLSLSGVQRGGGVNASSLNEALPSLLLQIQYVYHVDHASPTLSLPFPPPSLITSGFFLEVLRSSNSVFQFGHFSRIHLSSGVRSPELAAGSCAGERQLPY